MKVVTEQQRQNALAYWTPERMKQAVPDGIRSDGGPMAVSGEPFRVDVNLWPYRCGGKLFYTKNREPRVASAQFVGHCRMILTAAHSVRSADDGEYWEDLLFVRGYEGNSPQHVAIQYVKTQDDWVGAESDEHRSAIDYAWCYADADSNAGYLIMQLGLPYTEIQSIGYPLDFEVGEAMYAVNGVKGRVRNGVVDMEGNPMRTGASGGAWLAKVAPDCADWLTNIVVGLNSRFLTDQPTYVGPLFDQRTFDLFNEVLEMGTGPGPFPPGDQCPPRDCRL